MQQIEVDVPFDQFQVNPMSNGKERRPSERSWPSQRNQSIKE
jgi:hypothetical protein